jgi:DNA anti-recombination protein RmuC
MDIEDEQNGKKKGKKKRPDSPSEPLKTGDEVIDEALQKLNELSNTLTSQINEIFAEGNIAIKDIKRFLDDSKNFSPSQYEMIQEEREKLLENLWTKLGKKAKETHTKKENDLLAKKRSRKFIGSRKNWISMR